MENKIKFVIICLLLSGCLYESPRSFNKFVDNEPPAFKILSDYAKRTCKVKDTVYIETCSAIQMNEDRTLDFYVIMNRCTEIYTRANPYQVEVRIVEAAVGAPGCTLPDKSFVKKVVFDISTDTLIGNHYTLIDTLDRCYESKDLPKTDKNYKWNILSRECRVNIVMYENHVRRLSKKQYFENTEKIDRGQFSSIIGQHGIYIGNALGNEKCISIDNVPYPICMTPLNKAINVAYLIKSHYVDNP